MNKSELIDALFQRNEELKFTKSEIESILSSLNEVIKSELKAGKKVLLPGIGSFDLVDKKERMGINPATGEKITIKEKKAPKFKFIKSFKDSMNA